MKLGEVYKVFNYKRIKDKYNFGNFLCLNSMPFYDKEEWRGETYNRNHVNVVSEDAAIKFTYVIL